MAAIKAISYLRFSTARQGREGRDSYSRQSNMAEQWSTASGIPLEKDLRYEDLGVSGFKGKNAAEGALKVLLGEVKKPSGRIRPGDYLLVEAIDRLSRMPPLDAFDLCRKIVEAGLTIITLGDGQEYSREKLNNDPGKMYILLGAIQAAHEYSKRLSQRISHSQAMKRQLMAAGQKTRHACPRWLRWDGSTKSYLIYQSVPPS